MKTLIHKIDFPIDNNLYIKREDLLPFSFGGNKVRIAYELFCDMLSKGKNCMICYGNARSNLCRVISDLCASKNIPCYIISPSDDDGTRKETINSRLCNYCNVEFRYCDKTNVSGTVQMIINECIDNGYNPYYIYGDIYGNGNEIALANAYKKVYFEIQEQKAELGVEFEYIFLATGTGMTQGGLLIGKHEFGGKEKIIGISIARDEEKAGLSLMKYIKAAENTEENFEDIFICDKYLNGGYGKYGISIASKIKKMYVLNGIGLDPTYSGKAFTGMCDYLETNGIHNKNILFIHTGGTPLFFDFVSEYAFNNQNIRQLKNVAADENKMKAFLYANSNEFAVPLSQKVDICSYTKKILEYGYAFAAINNQNEIEGIVCGYANDAENLIAFESVFVTVPESRGTGIAQRLFKTQLAYCRQCGMKKIIFSTDINNLAARKFYEKMDAAVRNDVDNSLAIHYEYDL